MTKRCSHAWFVSEWMLSNRSSNSDGTYAIPRFQKVIEVACSKCLKRKRVNIE